MPGRHVLLADENREAQRTGDRLRLLPVHELNPRTWSESIIRANEKSVERRRGCKFSGPLGPRVYTSRLLGRDKSLVLHGGGNTSVKMRENNLFGEEEDVLYVKGSGWDLETIEAAGFTPVKLDYVRAPGRPCRSLSDPQMVNELATHTLRAGAPAPSVETILHAILPHKYVDHTHADAVLSVSNAPDGEQRIRDIYGDKVVVIPYIMPGFDLAAYCAREFPKQKTRATRSAWCCSRTAFSLSAPTRATSYELMIELVSMAEDYLAAKKAWSVGLPSAAGEAGVSSARTIAQLRSESPRPAGFPLLCRLQRCAEVRSASRGDPDVARMLAGRPGHARPCDPHQAVADAGQGCRGLRRRYRDYFERNAAQAKEPEDHARPGAAHGARPGARPRRVRPHREGRGIVEELYEHTVDVILRAESLGGWRALDEQHIFDVEYWDLEQAKLQKAGSPPPVAGEVALVTGAASGIGKACAEAFLQRGAAVVGLDRNPAIESLWKRPDFLGLHL